MSTRKQERGSQFQLFGWMLFLVGCIFFIVDSIAAGSLLGIVGGATFFLGCVVFLIPLTWKKIG